MKEAFLNILRKEITKELNGLSEYNEMARLSQQRVKESPIGIFGLDDGYFLEKTEEQIIMEIYKKHISEINEEDTNDIYYYVGTFVDVLDEGGYYQQLGKDGYLASYTDDVINYVPKEVLRDDPKAEYRIYANVEGIYEYRLNLEDADEFERTHTIIYDEKANNYQSSAYWRMCNVTEDFIITSFKENQTKARSLILRKYNTNK